MGESIEVQSIKIENPRTYIVHWRQSGQECSDPSQIDASLAARPGPDQGGLPYWPWYARLTPAQRWVYLSWMASARDRLPPEDGFLFIYYYGLERRLFVDEEDGPEIVREVHRLRKLHAKEAGNSRSWSYQHYSSALLWYVVASRAKSVPEATVRSFAEGMHSWREEALLGALAWCVQNDKPCPPWLAMVVAEQLPGSTNSVVRKRLPEQFEQLFITRYRDTFGDGIKLRVSKRTAHASYKPASDALPVQSCEIPNVLGIKSQFTPLVEMWNACIDDLRGLSRVAGSDGLDEITPEAWEALPSELRKGQEHPLTDALTEVIGTHSVSEGPCLVPARELARLIGVEDRSRYTASQSRRIAETAQHVGYAVEPDARYFRSSYDADEKLSVFVWLYDQEPDSKRYPAAATMLRFAIAVAAADGNIADEEMHVLEEEIARMFDLNEHEVRRLDSLRELLILEGSDPRAVSKRLRDGLSATHRTVIARLLIAIAAADGLIHPDERKVLRKCYQALGLDPLDLDKALTELVLPQSDDLVSVERGASRRLGEPIPAPPSERAITLDPAAIRRIMAETHEVSSILAQAMSSALVEDHGVEQEALVEEDGVEQEALVEEDASEVAVSESEADLVSPPAGLESFFKVLVSRPAWQRSEIDGLARADGHMLSGVLEHINDWAYEALGAALIYDDGDTIHVETAHLNRRNS